MIGSEAQAQFYCGVGFKQEGRLRKSLVAFRAAADAGHGGAHTHIGLAYCHGYGGAQDEATALYWYRRAVELGDAGGMTAVGECYLAGAGVEQDIDKGLWWLRRAASKGDADAMFALGCCCADESANEAAEHYFRAAERGSVRAMCQLAACYRDGNGVPRHLGLAAEWCTRAGNGQRAEEYTASATCAVAAAAMGVPIALATIVRRRRQSQR